MAGNNRIPQLHAVYGPAGRLVCPHPPCNVTASQYWRMRDHILAAHHNILPWPCPRCPRSEHGRVRLTRHINADHANEANALNVITSRDRDVYQYPTGEIVIIYGDVVAHPPPGLPPVVPAPAIPGAGIPPILGGQVAGAPPGGMPPWGAPHFAAPAAPVGNPAPAGHPGNPAFVPHHVVPLHPAFAGHPAFAPQPVVQPGNAHFGNAQFGNAQSGNAQFGNAQPGNAQPGNAQPGNAQFGNAQPVIAQQPAAGLPAAPRPAFASLPDQGLLLAQPWNPQAQYVDPALLSRAGPPTFIPPARPTFTASPPPATGSPFGFAVGSPAGFAAGSPAPANPTFAVQPASPSPPSALFNFNGPSAPNFNFGSPNMDFATGPTSFQASPNLAAATNGPSGSTFAFADPNLAPPGANFAFNSPNLAPAPAPTFTFASPNLAPVPAPNSAFASPNVAPAAAPTLAPQGPQHTPPANAVPAHVENPNIAPPEYFAREGRSASSSNDSMDVDQYIKQSPQQQQAARVGEAIQVAPCGSVNCRCRCYEAGGRWCHNPTRGSGNYLQCPRCQGHG